MDEDAIIEQLEELIISFGIQIRREAIKQDEDSIHVAGGLCLLKGEYILIINSKATKTDRVKTLAMALKHFDLDRIYLRPVVRELLDKLPDQRPLHPVDKERLKDFP
ncbi:MAG TPA: hypothetical protein VEM15_06300 [Thermodesulfobacteriota bacterium]|nr:hypothetical protein [Thermodesulfobacteriota bacterium]